MAELYFTVKADRAEHPKWRALAKLGHAREAAASQLWLVLMGACSKAQNGGRVPDSWPHALLAHWPEAVVTTAVTDLVEHALLDVEDEGSWQVHDFDDHQHELLSAKATDEADEPPPGLSPEERRKWLAARRARRSRAGKASKRDGQRDARGSRSVTERDARPVQRDAKRDGERDDRDAESVTPSVTRHADPSRSVTLSGGPRHASPFFSTEEIEIRSDAGAREESESHAPSRVTRNADRHAQRDAEQRDEADESGLPRGFDEVVRATLHEAFKTRGLLIPKELRLGMGVHMSVVEIARSLATRENLEAAVRGFFADAKTASEGFPIRWLETNPNRYVQAGRTSAPAPTSAAPTAQPTSGSWSPSMPRWMPGGPESVTPCATLEELVTKLLSATRHYLAKVEVVPESQWPRELVDVAKYDRVWRDLATWACSHTYGLRRGNRDVPPNPSVQVSKIWIDAVKGWLADPLANGDGVRLSLDVLVSEPSRMAAEGFYVRRGGA